MTKEILEYWYCLRLINIFLLHSSYQGEIREKGEEDTEGDEGEMIQSSKRQAQKDTY